MEAFNRETTGIVTIYFAVILVCHKLISSYLTNTKC